MQKYNLVGYARVSTNEQNLDLQLNALRQAGVPESQIFQEHISGVRKNRPQFSKALKHLRRGDVFVVWKLDRLGRNLEELVRLSKELKERGIELKSLTEGVDTTTAMGSFFYHIMAALAQFERDLISERTKAGLEAAKERGTWKPRKPTIDRNQWQAAIDIVKAEPLIGSSELARRLPANKRTKQKPKRTTINNYLGDFRAGLPYPFVNA